MVLAYDPVLTEDVAEERAAARRARARIFDDPKKPRYPAVLDETVLRRPVGGPAVMAEQLRHIAQMVRRRRIVVHVLPPTEAAIPGWRASCVDTAVRPVLSGSRAHAQDRSSPDDGPDQPAQSFTFTVSPSVTIFGLWGVTSTTVADLQPGLTTLVIEPSFS